MTEDAREYSNIQPMNSNVNQNGTQLKLNWARAPSRFYRHFLSTYPIRGKIIITRRLKENNGPEIYNTVLCIFNFI